MHSRYYFPQTIILFMVVCITALVSISYNRVSRQSVSQQLPINALFTNELEEPTVTPIPNVSPPVMKGEVAEPVLSARSALVIDVASGEALFSKNSDLPLWPASTTKLMTALVVLDQYNLSDIITVENPVSQGRIMGLYAGEKISVNNLLFGMLIHSANDASYALADFYPEGRASFIAKMNQKAQELDLVNTHFSDPAGFDNDKQYSTATDLAELSLTALKNETIARIVSIPSITISDADYMMFHQLTNVNQLLGVVPGVAGVKTGYTENAKENLINLMKRDGHEILTVILGSDDRFGETQYLTEWAFANFSWESDNY